MPTIGVAEVLVRPSLKGFQKTVGKEFGAAEKGTEAAGKRHGDAFSAAFKVGAAAIAGGATAVAAFAAKGVVEFAKFEKGMNEVFTLLPGISKDAMGALQDDTRKFVREMGVAHDEAVPALYSALSAGVPKDNVFNFMEVAAKAAKGGVTDLNTAVDGISSATNAFKAQGLEAGDASDKMFTAVRLGKTTFGELSASLFNVSPVAAALGVKFGDVTASIAALTAQGVPTSVATTQMRSALTELSTSGSKAADVFEKASGKTFRDFIKQGGNVSEAFDVMAGAAEKSGLGVGDLFGSVEAAGAVMSLSGDNAAAFKSAIAEMGDSAGATDAAFSQMDRGLDRSWERIKIGVNDAALGLGEKLAPAVAVAADWLGEQLPKAVETLSGWFDTAVQWLTVDVPAAVQGVTGDFKDWRGVIDSISPYVETLVGWVGSHLPAAIDGGKSVIGELVTFLSTTLPDAIETTIGWIEDNIETLKNVATVITVILLPTFVRLAIGAMVSATTQVVAWVMTQTAAIRTGIVYVAQSLIIVARWVWMGVQALFHAGKQVVAWVMTQTAAIKSAAVYVVQSVIIIGRWAWMGAQALFHAGRMALAWLIAMGPIGWVIAAVVGLVAVVILNWDKISAFTRDMWEKHVKPVFDNLARFITKDVPAAFEKGVKWIGEAWAKLQDLAKAPVRFVVDTVINKGLIDGLNGIGGMLGLPKIGHVALPAGFAEGGYTGDGGKYQPAGIVHAGEFVFTKEQTRRAGVSNLYAMADALAGYAKGGLVNPLRNSVISQPFHAGHNGLDMAAPTGTPVGAAGKGRVSSAGWSQYGGGNEIHIDHPNGLQTWYAHLSSFAVKMGDMVRAGSKIGEVGSTGKSTGPHLHYMVLNGGWPNYRDPASYLTGGGEGGWNPIADIIDGLLSKFRTAFPAGGFFADMAIGAGKKMLDGALGFISGNGGKDNMGTTGMPYLHDNGGVLNPGLSSVLNATRKPEAILNARQWADIHRLATGNTGSGKTYNTTINQVDDPIGTAHAVTRRLASLGA